MFLLNSNVISLRACQTTGVCTLESPTSHASLHFNNDLSTPRPDIQAPFLTRSCTRPHLLDACPQLSLYLGASGPGLKVRLDDNDFRGLGMKSVSKIQSPEKEAKGLKYSPRSALDTYQPFLVLIKNQKVLGIFPPRGDYVRMNSLYFSVMLSLVVASTFHKSSQKVRCLCPLPSAPKPLQCPSHRTLAGL